MFTGIIEWKGIIKKKTASCLQVEAEAKFVRHLSIGASVAVDGACLTIADIPSKTVFVVDVMRETLQRTSLKNLKQNSPVNLELSLRVGSRLGGHIIQGHIDGTATIKSIRRSGGSCVFYFTAPAKLLRYIVEKGSVAVNGVSLTLINVTKHGFSIGVIPHTGINTALSSAKVGDTVNIEVDILAKYVEKLINHS